jgi:hypothetical protein
VFGSKQDSIKRMSLCISNSLAIRNVFGESTKNEIRGACGPHGGEGEQKMRNSGGKDYLKNTGVDDRILLKQRLENV